MVSNVKRKKWIWMDYTSEGGDDTKEAVLTDKCFLFSNELQHDSDLTVNSLGIFLTNHMSPPLAWVMLGSLNDTLNTFISIFIVLLGNITYSKNSTEQKRSVLPPCCCIVVPFTCLGGGKTRP